MSVEGMNFEEFRRCMKTFAADCTFWALNDIDYLQVN